MKYVVCSTFYCPKCGDNDKYYDVKVDNQEDINPKFWDYNNWQMYIKCDLHGKTLIPTPEEYMRSIETSKS